MDVMPLADRSWPVLRRLMAGHTVIYRATGGLIGHRFPGAPPMLLLDHVGAKSRVRRGTVEDDAVGPRLVGRFVGREAHIAMLAKQLDAATELVCELLEHCLESAADDVIIGLAMEREVLP